MLRLQPGVPRSEQTSAARAMSKPSPGDVPQTEHRWIPVATGGLTEKASWYCIDRCSMVVESYKRVRTAPRSYSGTANWQHTWKPMSVRHSRAKFVRAGGTKKTSLKSTLQNRTAFTTTPFDASAERALAPKASLQCTQKNGSTGSRHKTAACHLRFWLNWSHVVVNTQGRWNSKHFRGI